jgi:hypothetical protein
LPASVPLQLHRPPGFENDESFVESVALALTEAENRAAAELGREGRAFLGVARVLAQKPSARPAPGEPRRTMNPRVACRNKWGRIEALLRLAEFVRALPGGYLADARPTRSSLREIRLAVTRLLEPGPTTTANGRWRWRAHVQHRARAGETHRIVAVTRSSPMPVASHQAVPTGLDAQICVSPQDSLGAGSLPFRSREAVAGVKRVENRLVVKSAR